jgi:hypothetical protein
MFSIGRSKGSSCTGARLTLTQDLNSGKLSPRDADTGTATTVKNKRIAKSTVSADDVVPCVVVMGTANRIVDPSRSFFVVFRSLCVHVLVLRVVEI